MNMNERDVQKALACDEAKAIAIADAMTKMGFDWSQSTHSLIKRTAQRIDAETRRLAR